MSWRAGRRERARFLAGVGGLAAEELRMRRVGDGDRQSQFGGGGLEVFEETGERSDPPVEGFWGGPAGDEMIAPGVDVGDGGVEEHRRILRPADASEADEAHDVLAVGALGVRAGAARDPGFEDLRDGMEELLDAHLDTTGDAGGEDGGQLAEDALGGDDLCTRGLVRLFNSRDCVHAPLPSRLLLTAHDNRFYHAPSTSAFQGRGC
jgi:hypothetical protein